MSFLDHAIGYSELRTVQRLSIGKPDTFPGNRRIEITANCEASVTTPTTQPLTLSQKLAYGAGDMGPAITSNLLVFFWFPFLTNVVGLSAGVAGSILAISKIYDALTDPIIGVLSDRTKSRWGRRRPWLLFGAIPFGLIFLAQWVIPFPGNLTAMFWYYLALSICFSTAFSSVNLPYTALTPELTQDYNERTSLSNFRFAFSIGGSLVSGVCHPLIVQQFPTNPALGYFASAALWTVLSVLPLFWCFLGTREAYQSDEKSLPILQQIGTALSNRPYLFVIGIYLCSWLAVQMTATLIPNYITFWMRLPGEWVSYTILAVQGTAFLMLFVWTPVSDKIGKKAVYLIGMVIWIVAQVGLFTLQPGQTTLMLVLAVLAGMGVSVAYLIPWSMLPDVIELDELETGQRREGIFYAAMVLFQKVGIALGLFIVGQALDRTGFLSTTTGAAIAQPESAQLALRILIGPVPTIIIIISMALTWFYPITKATHAVVLAQLAERKRTQEAS
ncbi:MAG: MFS transporter [Anaerolineae bacterium]|nr:MFS transporter [Gloeobacterales cyanobacterium ES-bin-313]